MNRASGAFPSRDTAGRPPPPGVVVWNLALGCFVLAAATGAAFRFGMVFGLPFDLSFGNVRHAHSHLMFFGWVTPVLMVLSPSLRGGSRPSVPRLLALAALSTGLSSYLPFLLSGYGRFLVAGRDLPLSMMTAGLAGVVWYGFALVHASGTRGEPRSVPLRAFDGAVLALVWASAAATALAAVGMMGMAGTAWMPALIRAFLEAFADGWFVLGLLAFAFRGAGAATHTRAAHAAVALLPLALVFRSVARLGADVVADRTGAPAVAASFAFAALLLVALAPLLRWTLARPGAWTLPLLLLAAKAIFESVLSWPAARAWSDAMGLHVILLHAFLLGSVSLGLVAAARDRWGPRSAVAPSALAAAVLVMLAFLVPLTRLWPTPWSGEWILHAAAWSSLAPPVVVLIWAARVAAARPVARRGSGDRAGAERSGRAR